MKRAPAEYRLLLTSHVLVYVDDVLRAMAADPDVPDPVATLRRLVAESTAEDAIARRYGVAIRAIRGTFIYRHNRPLVEAAIQQSIEIAGSLL